MFVRDERDGRGQGPEVVDVGGVGPREGGREGGREERGEGVMRMMCLEDKKRKDG